MRVLLVDDMQAVRALLRVYLMEFQFEFLEARDGREGLELFRRERPDLVVLDHQMPGLTGMEVLREAWKDPALARTPVVVLSADTELTLEGPPGTRTALVHKPVEPGALKDVVRGLLGQRAA